MNASGLHNPEGLVFVFSPQGGQWQGMGRRLYDEEQVFQETVGKCDFEIRRHLGWSLVAELTGCQDNYRLHDDPARIQPALTTIQIALGALLRSFGVEPAAVAGLRMGEVAAAHFAGVFSLADALKIVCCQARLTARKQRKGSMAFVNLDLDRARGFINHGNDTVAIAVELNPEVSVLSGEAQAIESVLGVMRRSNIDCGMVPVGFAFHSPEVAILKDEFFASLMDVQPGEGRIPVYSAVAGDLKNGRAFGVDHWWSIMSGPALFASTVKRLLRHGHKTFVEIGPHPMLLDSIQKTAHADGQEVATIGLLYRDSDDHMLFTEAVRAVTTSRNKAEENKNI